MVSKLHWPRLVHHLLSGYVRFYEIERLFELRSWNVFVRNGGERVRFLFSWDLSIKNRFDKLFKLYCWFLWAHVWFHGKLPLLFFWVLLCFSCYKLLQLRNWKISTYHRLIKLRSLPSWEPLPLCCLNVSRGPVHCWVLLRIVRIRLHLLLCR